MISVLICGLVRNEQLFIDKLSEYSRWKKDGYVRQIIYSTWIGEIDRYSGLRDELNLNNVKIIEIEEPKLVLKGGHQLHQMLTLHYGLEAIVEDDFVLKTRVDLADNNDNMLTTFKTGTAVCDDFLKIGLTNKILVETARMELPFLCTDAQFFGAKHDLKRLVNLSAEFELLYNNLAVEQCFFFNPFRHIGIFKRHFYWNLPHFSGIANQRSLQYEFILNQQELLDVLGSWWVILYSYFQIGWEQRSEPSDRIDSLLEGFELNAIDKKISTGDGSGVINSSIFVSRLLKLLEANDVARIKNGLIINAINASPVAIPVDIFQMYEQFRLKFSTLPYPKAVACGVNQSLIRGVPQHFFVKGENDSASTRYHEQVTFLRREIDTLQIKLNTLQTHSLLHRMMSRLLDERIKESIRNKYPKLLSIYIKYLK